MPGNDSDRLILVDLADHEVGSCGKLEAHERGLLHRAFSVVLLDGDRMLMTRRALGKYHSGGLWTNTCCSHPRVGETVGEAVPRRLAEELGITGAACHEVGTYCYRAAFPNGLVEYEMDHVLVGEWAGTCQPDPAEVMDLRWVAIGQVMRDVAERPERFTAWLPGVLALALRQLASVLEPDAAGDAEGARLERRKQVARAIDDSGSLMREAFEEAGLAWPTEADRRTYDQLKEDAHAEASLLVTSDEELLRHSPVATLSVEDAPKLLG